MTTNDHAEYENYIVTRPPLRFPALDNLRDRAANEQRERLSRDVDQALETLRNAGTRTAAEPALVAVLKAAKTYHAAGHTLVGSWAERVIVLAEGKRVPLDFISNAFRSHLGV